MSFCVREKLLGFFYIMLLFPHCYVPLFPLKCSSSTNFSLNAKKRTGGKTTTYICTGVNTAKKILCLRVAFDFCFFFLILNLNFRPHESVFSKKDNNLTA